MASSISFNSSVFKNRADNYLGRMRSSSITALERGKKAILAEALMRAPSPQEEKRIILGYDAETVFERDNADAADQAGARERFLKEDGQYYIQEVLSNPEFEHFIFTPDDTSSSVGFRIANLLELDRLTRFSWINASINKGNIQTYGPFTSKHGSFFAFEYGWQYDIYPVNAKLLSPEPRIKAPSARKTVPAHGMFTSISPWAILEEMKGVLREVQFIEE